MPVTGLPRNSLPNPPAHNLIRTTLTDEDPSPWQSPAPWFPELGPARELPCPSVASQGRRDIPIRRLFPVKSSPALGKDESRRSTWPSPVQGRNRRNTLMAPCADFSASPSAKPMVVVSLESHPSKRALVLSEPQSLIRSRVVTFSAPSCMVKTLLISWLSPASPLLSSRNSPIGRPQDLCGRPGAEASKSNR